jgi:biotin carboxylase
MKNKKILVIGGGKWQVPLVKKAKSLGLYVICTNLYPDSPAFAYSDLNFVVDVLDVERNYIIAKEHQVHSVVTDQSDIAVITVALINQRLGLCGVGYENAQLFTDKSMMRTKLQVPGLRHPRYQLCDGLDEVEAFLQASLIDQVVIKPTNNQSSRGVNFISRQYSRARLTSLVENTLQHNKGVAFLCEEFIPGIELTVEGFKAPNLAHQSLAVSKKSHYAASPFVASSLNYHLDFIDCNVKDLFAINDALYADIPFAITHTEYKYYNGDFYLVEAAIRGGGTKISSDIVPLISGYDIGESLIQCSLGENCKPPPSYNPRVAAILSFFTADTGVVVNITGQDKIKASPNIVDIELEINVGDYVSIPKDDRARAGYYIGTAKSDKEMERVINFVDNNICISTLENNGVP